MPVSWQCHLASLEQARARVLLQKLPPRASKLIANFFIEAFSGDETFKDILFSVFDTAFK